MKNDIVYYKNYRLVLSFDGYWYSEQFKDTFNSLSAAKKFIDKYLNTTKE